MSKKKCISCEKEKDPVDGFYLTNNKVIFADQRTPLCKDCIKRLIDPSEKDSLLRVLRIIDKPFLEDAWIHSLESERETVGEYMRMIGMTQHRHKTWDSSEFNRQENSSEAVGVNSVDLNLVNKWGEGYTNEEYRSFERKYQMLKNNYQEKTAMHTEALLTYIRYRVKEELSTAKGLVKDAKEWGSLAQKAAQDAKINPSQLSKADLSDGLDTIGQLVRAVETHEDIIPILPQFKSRPQDKVDFNLWCYVNYIRDLKGLPLADYSDIYAFYEARKKEYANDPDSLDGDEM